MRTLRTAILLAAQMGAQLERGEVLQQSLQSAGGPQTTGQPVRSRFGGG
nr:hypothetical protein [Thalassolituus marinus]